MTQRHEELESNNKAMEEQLTALRRANHKLGENFTKLNEDWATKFKGKPRGLVQSVVVWCYILFALETHNCNNSLRMEEEYTKKLRELGATQLQERERLDADCKRQLEEAQRSQMTKHEEFKQELVSGHILTGTEGQASEYQNQ